MSTIATARIAPRDTEEYEIRVQLAACYRLMHKYAMTDLIFTHVSARLPDTDGHFLLNPFGLRFDEITASSLVEVDREGNVVGDSQWGVNWAGFIIHSAILHARYRRWDGVERGTSPRRSLIGRFPARPFPLENRWRTARVSIHRDVRHAR